MPDEQALTIRDIVIKMNVNEKTVRRWIHSGELKATKDIFGRYQITTADLNDFIQKRKEKYNPSEA